MTDKQEIKSTGVVHETTASVEGKFGLAEKSLQAEVDASLTVQERTARTLEEQLKVVDSELADRRRARSRINDEIRALVESHAELERTIAALRRPKRQVKK